MKVSTRRPLVELERDVSPEFDLGQRGGRQPAFFSIGTPAAKALDDLVADMAAESLGDHGRGASGARMQRDRERIWAAACSCRADRGMPGMGRGHHRRRPPAEYSRRQVRGRDRAAPRRARRIGAELVRTVRRSSHSVTAYAAPISTTWAWTAPIGSISRENRARQTGPPDSGSPSPWRWPSREISNWAMAVPCGSLNRHSKFQRAPQPSRAPGSLWSGRDAA